MAHAPFACDTRATAAGRGHESLGPARTLLVAVYFVVAIWYLAWRPNTLNPDAPLFSLLVYGAELFGFAVASLHIFMVWRLSIRVAPTAAAGLRVDVFVTSYDEPIDLLRRTLLAAMHMDYAHQTWLLDDGNRPQARALAEALGCRYLARERNTDAKAGNLNHALAHSDADFIAVFDADHAPARAFLTRTLGYFQDAAVAFVQTPQDFYNLDSYQHRLHPRRRLVWTEQSLFFRVIQRGKDCWNAAFFCGSCAVLRRAALDAVGGFATGSVTEDLQTSIHLHRRGFASVYHAEALSFGVAPATVKPFLRQRIRWGSGAMVALRSLGVWFGRGLTLPQRLGYLASVLTYFDGWQKAIFYLAPAVVLLTGVMPIAELSWRFLAHFLPFYILTFWVYEEVGRGYGRSVMIEQYNMARFAAFAWATFGLVRHKLAFRVTAKHRVDGERPGRWIVPQLSVLALNVVAIAVGVLVTWPSGSLPTGALAANVVWAGVNASLAQAVVVFTARLARHRREAYRFPIPLPALLRFGDAERIAGVLDDISPEGFKFYGSFPSRAAAIGTQAFGEIYLPSGGLACKAEVRCLFHATGPVHHAKALGCRFQWDRDSDRRPLELFLYGSDLQWHANGLVEQATTPLQWLQRVAVGHTHPAHSVPAHWASVLSRPRGSPFAAPDLALLSVPPRHIAGRTLVTYRRLNEERPVRLDVVTRAGMHTLEGRIHFVDSIATGSNPVHFYRFQGQEGGA